ncbi:MAG: AAA family ATPase, partial [Bifidobacteriaceae bacterium]|nr:AAA family ATPase [Bifidobacteriaceae bacterium]
METPGKYIPRLVDKALAAQMEAFGAVLVEGPKWCGKTWTAMRLARSVAWIADPAGNYAIRRMAIADPYSLFEADKPILLDEWQDAPGVWDAVRLSVDRVPGAGQYLLTGSATPKDSATSHSGTGRIARLRMWPMSLAETGLSSAAVSLSGLMNGDHPKTAPGGLSEPALIEAILRGGWPGTVASSSAHATALPRAYLESVAESDASRIDGIRRDPVRMLAVLQSLARNTATVVNNSTLARDMAGWDAATASTKTIADYLDVLRRLSVLREIPAWSTALRSPVRLRRRPKRILVDPSLAAAGIGATADTLKADRKTLGLLLENLCLRDLSVYAQNIGATVWHYRDESGL